MVTRPLPDAFAMYVGPGESPDGTDQATHARAIRRDSISSTAHAQRRASGSDGRGWRMIPSCASV
jgi:hypothetical protein